MSKLVAGASLLGCVALCAGTVQAVAHTDAPAATTTCSASGKVKFTPPLTLTPAVTQHVYTKANTSLTGCGGGVTSGHLAGTLTGNNDSCAGATASGTWTFFWNTGKRSRVTVTGTTQSNGVVSYAGTVVSGTFRGSALTGSLTFTPSKGKCTASGVSQATFTGSLTI